MYYIKTMKTCFFSCKENTVKSNSNDGRTKQDKLMLVSNCADCGEKTIKIYQKSRGYWIRAP